MNRLNKKRVILLLLPIVVLIFIFLLFNYLTSTQKIYINLENVSQAEIITITPDDDHDNDDIKAKKINKSQTLRLKKQNSYLVHYTGLKGFASGEVVLIIKPGVNNFNINPYFSDSKLGSILQTELLTIRSTVLNKFPNIERLYKYTDEKLYHYGEWYSARLKYIGDDNFNSDSLLLLLNKQDGVWKIVSSPPQIILGTVDYPNIPGDILTNINNP